MDSHGLDKLVADVHVADGLGALLFFVLGLLDGDDLAILEGDLGLHVAAVRSLIFELLSQFELEVHSRKGGGGLDDPLAPGVADLSDGVGGALWVIYPKVPFFAFFL